MKKLWIAFLVLATLGSIYPFDFQWVPLDSPAIKSFLKSCCMKPGRGDVLGNIILFMPIGFVGMFALRPEALPRERIAYLGLIALIFGIALQIVQIYLPSRDENLQDVLWNMIGTFAGIALAMLANRNGMSPGTASFKAEVVPIALIATWLTYRLMPFVPSIDLQLIKDSIKPLFEFDLTFANVIPDVAAWLVVGYLLRAIRPAASFEKFLPGMITMVFFLEVLTVDNVLYTSDVVAAIIAVAALPIVLRTSSRPEVILVALLLLGVVLNGLSPFALNADGSDFNWLPFHGFLSGSMYINALSAAQKVFVYGSLVFLLRELSVSYVISVAVVFVTVFIVELAQTRLVGHTAEITDPLLVLFAALALLSLSEKSTRSTPGQPPLPKRGLRGSQHTALQSGRWDTRTVNLNGEQYQYLKLLSGETRTSPSRTVRVIVDNFINEYESAQPRGAGKAIDYQQLAEQVKNQRPVTHHTSTQWFKVTVNLRRKQLDWLAKASETLAISESGVIRFMVTRFFEPLDDHIANEQDNK